MLQLMRNSTGNVVIKVVIFGILIIGMASYAFIDMFTAQVQGTKVASVGDREIAYEDYQRAYQFEMRRLQQIGLTSEMAQTLNIGNSVASRLITEAVFDAEADDLAITVTDDAAVAAIRQNQAFQDDLGNFSRAQFQFALSRSGMNEALYVQSLKTGMARDAFMSSMTDAVTLPSSLGKALALYQTETRQADYIILPISMAPAISAPTDESLRNFYGDTKNAYEVPELKSFSYILIDPEALAKNIVPAEEDLIAAYETRRAAFVSEEKRDLDQFIFGDQEAAQAAYDRMIAGERFETVGQEITGDSASTYKLGFVAKEDFLSEAAADFIFSQNDLGILPPVEGDFGWVIYRLNDIQEEEAQPLEEVRAILTPEVILEKAIDQAYEMSSELTDLMSGGATLQEASEALSLPLVSDVAVDRQGRDSNGQRLQSLPTDDFFLETVFDALDGDITLVEQIEGNRFFVANVTETIPTRTKSFDEVRDQVLTAWTQDQRLLKLSEQAEGIVEKINSGDSLSMTSGELSLPLSETGAMMRNGSNKPDALPDALLAQIFELSVGKAAFAEYEGGVAIAELKSSDQEASAEIQDATQNQLDRNLQNSLLNSLNTALRNKHEVSVNPEAISSVYSNGHAGM